MKVRDGRFQKETASVMDDFHSSIHFDQRLAEVDIDGSMAHARMLGECGIIARDEAQTIITGLERVRDKVLAGSITWDPKAEDIHMNIEQFLVAEIGVLGKKLHTARSRNDQVALDGRLYLLNEIEAVRRLLRELFAVLLEIAGREAATILPGYTHLQRAQPVLLAHHLLAYFEMFRRDWERLEDCKRRTAISPLGSGALAGTGFPIDRAQTAEALGFSTNSANSLDGVSDRDFALEFCFTASLIMMHLSRCCEELVIWSSREFGFVEMDDAYSTGSSIMPQKKNPDVAELIRGKTGRVYGDLIALLTMMKGLPLTYNKDMQEDKEAFFDASDTIQGCLTIFVPMLRTLVFNRERMLEATRDGFLNATDLADYLAAKGMPFREAHAVAGRLVGQCIESEKRLEELSLDELKKEAQLFESDVFEKLKMENVVKARNSYGGTAPEQVELQLEKAREWLRGL
jgi:argininosuccinate lyase